MDKDKSTHESTVGAKQAHLPTPSNSLQQAANLMAMLQSKSPKPPEQTPSTQPVVVVRMDASDDVIADLDNEESESNSENIRSATSIENEVLRAAIQKAKSKADPTPGEIPESPANTSDFNSLNHVTHGQFEEYLGVVRTANKVGLIEADYNADNIHFLCNNYKFIDEISICRDKPMPSFFTILKDLGVDDVFSTTNVALPGIYDECRKYVREEMPDYYRGFMARLNWVYPRDIYVMTTIVILADEIYQVPLNNSWRIFLAFLLLVDESIHREFMYFENIGCDPLFYERLIACVVTDRKMARIASEPVLKALLTNEIPKPVKNPGLFFITLNVCLVALSFKRRDPELFYCNFKWELLRPGNNMAVAAHRIANCDLVWSDITLRHFDGEIISRLPVIYRPPPPTREPTPVPGTESDSGDDDENEILSSPEAKKDEIKENDPGTDTLKVPTPSKNVEFKEKEPQPSTSTASKQKKKKNAASPLKRDVAYPLPPYPEKTDDNVQTLRYGMSTIWTREAMSAPIRERERQLIANLREARNQVTAEDPDIETTNLEPLTFTDDDTTPENWKAKYGDFCITQHGVHHFEYTPEYAGNIQNILQVLTPIVNGNPRAFAAVNLGEETFTRVQSDIHLPHEYEQLRRQEVNAHFPKLILKSKNLSLFVVKSDGAKKIQENTEIPHSLEATPGVFDTRRVQSSLLGEVAGVNRAFAESFLRSMSLTRDYYSWLQVYSVAWMQYFMLQDMEASGIHPEVDGLHPDDITTFMMEGQQVEAQRSIARSAIEQGRITLLYHEATPERQQCMRLISAGTQSLRTPADCAVEHIGTKVQYITYPLWCVIGAAGYPVEIPPNVNVTSTDMLEFINWLTISYGREKCCATGLIRAATLLTVRIKTVRDKGRTSSFMLNAANEVQGTTMPRVMGENWMYRVMHYAPNIIVSAPFKPEVNAIISTPPYMRRNIALTAALVVSLGFAHVMHSFNLTGTQLSCAYRDVPDNSAMSLIQQLIMGNTIHGVAPISIAAVNYVSGISTFSICADTFYGSLWSSTALTQSIADRIQTWRHLFPRCIPYFVQPLVVFFLSTLWDEKWGYCRPGVQAEFYKELTPINDRLDRQWHAAIGDSMYVTRARSNRPYIYVPYGNLSMNLMMQQARENLQRLRWQYIAHQTSAFPIVERPVLDQNIVIPFLDILFAYHAGYIVTYDWARNRVIAPALTLEEQNGEVQTVLEGITMRPFQRAGLCTPTTLPHGTVNLDLSTLKLDNPSTGNNNDGKPSGDTSNKGGMDGVNSNAALGATSRPPNIPEGAAAPNVLPSDTAAAAPAVSAAAASVGGPQARPSA